MAADVHVRRRNGFRSLARVATCTPLPAGAKTFVRGYQLGNEHENKTALLSLFRRVLRDTAPVHVIATRTQAVVRRIVALTVCSLDIAQQEHRLVPVRHIPDQTELEKASAPRAQCNGNITNSNTRKGSQFTALLLHYFASA